MPSVAYQRSGDVRGCALQLVCAEGLASFLVGGQRCGLRFRLLCRLRLGELLRTAFHSLRRLFRGRRHTTEFVHALLEPTRPRLFVEVSLHRLGKRRDIRASVSDDAAAVVGQRHVLRQPEDVLHLRERRPLRNRATQPVDRLSASAAGACLDLGLLADHAVADVVAHLGRARLFALRAVLLQEDHAATVLRSQCLVQLYDAPA
eukprot:COSAG03_NODE_189_length_10920_cov_16.612328_3_plen_204_part_00